MKSLRRVVLLSLGLLSVIAAGVTTVTSSSAGGAHHAKTFTIGYSSAIAANPSLAANEAGVRVQAAKLGIDVVSTDAQFNASKQITDIDSLIQRGVDAILLVPVNNDAIEPALQRARDKGIIVVAREGLPRDPWNAAFNGTNFASSQLAAKYMAKRLGKNAGIGIIQGNPSTSLLRARNEGFDFGAKQYGLNVLDARINLKDSADGARPIADAWKVKYGSSMKGILAYNDPSAIGAASAAGGGFDPMIIGFNGTPDAIQAVKDGKLQATIDISSAEQGQAMAWVTWQILHKNKNCPRLVNVPFKLFDKSNVDQWIPFADRTKAALPVHVITKKGQGIMLVGTPATQYAARLKKEHHKVLC